MTVCRTWLPPAWRVYEKVFGMVVGESGVVFPEDMFIPLVDSRYQSKLVFASERETGRERLARRMWKTPCLFGLDFRTDLSNL